MAAGSNRPGDAVAPCVVPLPAEIDLGNADTVGDRLAAALESGAGVVVADLTSTTFCDTGGVRSVVKAHRQAEAAGAELRLAVSPDGAVCRVLDIMGLTSFLRVHASVSDALADGEVAGR